jgi:hypothetical protein
VTQRTPIFPSGLKRKIAIFDGIKLICLLLSGLLAGCSQTALKPLPSQPVEPTLQQVTAVPPTLILEATATSTQESIEATLPDTSTPVSTPTFVPAATDTASPLPTTTPPAILALRATATGTITPTPDLPLPAIVLASPGELSKLRSPIHIQAAAMPGEDGMVRVELMGEDGTMIARQVLDYKGWVGRRVTFAPAIPFELSLVAETARLTVRTVDRHGRTSALASADVVLLSEGENEINPLVSKYEPYILTQPYDGKVVKGGVVNIVGRARLVSSSVLQFALIDENVETVASKALKLSPASGYQDFSLDLPYTVNQETSVRLTVSQTGERLPGIVALSSELITLRP